ncbi:MAG: 30S ribosomal protein S3 [Candidatus Aenigmarchaeota archaeon]|nr:30S ribosomal protein S3 [Candidatus Aenigmarchaeota archaeon]
MAVEKYFIKEGMKETQIEQYLKNKFDRAGYSHIDIQRTPLGTRITVFAEKPGLVIGRSGKKINDITDEIKEKFKMDNPMLDVKEVDDPFLDAQIVANKIAKSIERGGFYKKIVNFFLEKIMESGAVGVEIRTAGKLGGERGRFQTFKNGYIKHAGYYADNLIDKGYSHAILKLGSVGVQVKILKEIPEDLSAKRISEKVKEVEDKRNTKNEG